MVTWERVEVEVWRCCSLWWTRRGGRRQDGRGTLMRFEQVNTDSCCSSETEKPVLVRRWCLEDSGKWGEPGGLVVVMDKCGDDGQ